MEEWGNSALSFDIRVKVWWCLMALKRGWPSKLPWMLVDLESQPKNASYMGQPYVLAYIDRS